ncbi:hypothetical protein CsSME_00021029 [Camellia sinensis var. sinensis]
MQTLVGRATEKKIRAKAQLNLPSLPEEIVIEIFSRLPLKSLVKFTLVSKQWRALIQSVSVKIVPRNNVLVRGRFSLHSIDQDFLVKIVDEPVKKNPYEIFGSCNGLLLIRIRDHLFLWNPLTKCSTKVLSYESLLCTGYTVVSGLCFDSFSNEYKAVMALSHDITLFGGEFVVVGSLRSKTWTEINFPYHFCSVKSGPVVNENLHWFASNKSSDRFFAPREIIYFNPRMNKFKKLPMPQPKNGDGDIILGLGVLEGCLCMVRCYDEHPSGHVGIVELLAMKEYGMQESWTTMFIISNLPELGIYDNVVPLCFIKNGELLIKVGRKHLRAYNPNDNSQRDVTIPTYLDAIVYEESVVTPTGYNWEEEVLRGEAIYVETSLSGSRRKIRKVIGKWDYEELDSGEEEHRVLDLEEE